jgi:glutathione S-transferase
MLTVHHLGKSQSERIVWLCEELKIPYELKCYMRDAKTMLAPPDYKALHPIGAAPVITDGDVVLAESGAVVDYIIAKYGNGRLALRADHPDFAPPRRASTAPSTSSMRERARRNISREASSPQPTS